MILQEDRITIKLDTCTFYTHEPLPMPDGTRRSHYRLDEVAIDGWYDGVSTRRTSEPRPTSHGDFRTPATLASRVISLSGTAIAKSPAELHKMRDDLLSICNDGGYKVISVDTSSIGVRYTAVGLEGKPQWSRKTDLYATFKLDLFAPDPHVYGEARQYTLPGIGYTSGMKFPVTYPLSYGSKANYEVQNVVNMGNADAWPEIWVYGELPEGFSVTDGRGNWITYTETVTNKKPVILLFDKGMALQGGKNMTTYLTRRDWFPVERNQTKMIQPRLSFPSNNGQGWMEVWVRDTWI